MVGGPLGRLDFVLRALRALRACDPRNDVVIGLEEWICEHAHAERARSMG